MKTIKLAPYSFALFAFATAHFAYAVQPIQVTCGDGDRIEVPDSSPHSATRACLIAGHPAPNKVVTSAKSLQTAPAGKRKIVRINRPPKQLASPHQQASGPVDHSDFILMAQGCHCISPNCVAYSCPADVDVP